jgi:glycosyltransferase involved in cell wall biosynthesis
LSLVELMSRTQRRVQHCFVVPALGGAVTGGTLYNRELCAALSEAGCELAVCELGSVELASALSAAQRVWVDSLYLDALPELERAASCPVGLLVHYLPTMVALGRAARPSEIGVAEQRALRAADVCLVTSDFMREALEPLVATPQSILVVAPGCRAQLAPLKPRAPGGLRALLVGNVVPGKGIEPFLRGLAESLREGDKLSLSIIGDLDADRGYGERCQRSVRESPALAERVTWRGALSPEQTLAELSAAELLISASVMESYGMALAEARVMGVPILARSGGNVASHVDERAGGELVASISELVVASLELARAPAQARQRIENARRHALSARRWPAVAQAFIAQLASLEK